MKWKQRSQQMNDMRFVESVIKYQSQRRTQVQERMNMEPVKCLIPEMKKNNYIINQLFNGSDLRKTTCKDKSPYVERYATRIADEYTKNTKRQGIYATDI